MRHLRMMIGWMLVVTASGLLLMACGASDETRRGEFGEFCNGRDDDCRDGLACVDGVCDTLGPKADYSCEDMCAKLDGCDASQQNCVGDCRTTLADWSLEAQNAFGACVVEDVTCAEAQEEFVPQLCYSRLPLDDAKKATCYSFADVARQCTSDADTDAIIDGCYRLARTGTDDDWAATDRCKSAVDIGICSGIATCFNDVFNLDSPIDLGDGLLPTNSVDVPAPGPL